MSNGLYNGLDIGLHNGLYEGMDRGMRNGLYNNDSFIKRNIVKDGLQLFLDFSNPRCYNYGKGEVGNIVYDLSNYRRNLSVQNLSGRATADSPYVDYSPVSHWNNYTLNGVGQSYLKSPNNTDFDIGTNAGFTISMWINVPIATTDYNVFAGKTIAGFVTGRWQFHFMNNMALGFLTQPFNNDILQTADNVLVLNRWHYVTATYSRIGIDAMKIYVDRNLVASLASANTTTNYTVNAPFCIGIHSQLINASGARFKMNFAKWYNRPLTIEEIRRNYETTKQFMKV